MLQISLLRYIRHRNQPSRIPSESSRRLSTFSSTPGMIVLEILKSSDKLFPDVFVVWLPSLETGVRVLARTSALLSLIGHADVPLRQA